MEQTVIYLLMVQKLSNFKAKDSEIVATPLCPGNISKDWSVDNMKKKLDYMGISMVIWINGNHIV